MSREIKFRAWDVEEKEYYYDAEYTYDFLCSSRGCYAASFGELLEHPERYEVEQYTGIKDKNGKEIYEGDILKIPVYDRVYQVVYRKWDCSFVCENDEDEDIVHIFDSFPQDYEIIGNIHENLELLGGEE